ncbi:MAG: 30S ribosome-binding factor RbfA [bacterium]
MVSERRQKRIEGEIQKVIASGLELLTDPHLRLVTVTRVEVSDDMKTAVVFYVSHKKNDQIQQHLNKIRGMMRAKLGKEINLRYTPEVFFELDKGLDYQMSMDNLFKQITNEESGKEDS